MKKFKHIYLTGCMGSGKSTVGSLMASKLGRGYVDLDKLIERRERKSINRIFELYGESGFRDLETQALLSLPDKPLVVATGGGIVTREKNRRIMKERGAILWLDISVDTLARRLRGDRSRPLLRGKNLRRQLEKTLNERHDQYADCTYRIDADKLTPLQIIMEVQKYLKS